MSTIVSNLSDPAWWFTAFFIAIVASVLAGFLKDRLERSISRTSDGFRQKRAASIEERSKTVQSLVENPVYLSFALHRLTLIFVLWSLTTFMFALLPVSLYATPPSEDVFMWLGCKDLFRTVMMPILGVASTFMGYRASTSMSLIFEAVRTYRKKHGLPKLP